MATRCQGTPSNITFHRRTGNRQDRVDYLSGRARGVGDAHLDEVLA